MHCLELVPQRTLLALHRALPLADVLYYILVRSAHLPRHGGCYCHCHCEHSGGRLLSRGCLMHGSAGHINSTLPAIPLALMAWFMFGSASSDYSSP